MSMDPRRWRGAGGAAAAAPDLAPPSPGKVTLTQRLTRAPRPPSPSAAPPSLQADRGAVLPLDPFALHEIAAAGVGDRTESLPHLPALQASFGHHDLSEVRAQIGGPAAGATAALGARAYAYGDAVAFAAPPDLRLAAHEAAHVVQQRGGVRLDGGVGRVGDPYEQHADAVADRVVRGESAEDLLDTLAHRGAAGGPAVQRMLSEDEAHAYTIVYVRCGGAATAPAIIDFEKRRNPAAHDASAAVADAGRHDVAAPDLPDTTTVRRRGADGEFHAVERAVQANLAGLRLDAPDYTSGGRAAMAPVDPDDPEAVITSATGDDATLRAVFIRHRDAEVERMFQTTTAVVLAARQLAREAAAAGVAGAAELAEAVRVRLFTANQYAVVHTLNPASSARYAPAPGFTACNLYVFDALRAMGVPEAALPSHDSADAEGGAILNATHGDANATAPDFLQPPLDRYWEDLGQDPDRAQAEANAGHLVICAGRGTSHAGHYSLILAENDTRDGARAHRTADGVVDSTLESQAGGGRASDADGVALDTGATAPDDGRAFYTANWNYDSRAARAERRDAFYESHAATSASERAARRRSAEGDGRAIDWWRRGHDGHFLRYRGGGVGSASPRSSYHLESETSMGMDYDAPTTAGRAADAEATVAGDGGVAAG
jgi:hypothetical protein